MGSATMAEDVFEKARTGVALDQLPSRSGVDEGTSPANPSRAVRVGKDPVGVEFPRSTVAAHQSLRPEASRFNDRRGEVR